MMVCNKCLLHLLETYLSRYTRYQDQPEIEFKEFEPRFKSAKPRFKLSAGLNLETFDTIYKWNQP